MIKSGPGGTTITGADISRFALLSLRGALSLEVKGIKMYRGTSAYETAKKRFGFKGSKEKVLAQLDEFVKRNVEPIMNSEWETPQPIKCSECGAKAVVMLTDAEQAEQTDGTTHVCHPTLGGCNYGFKPATEEG